MAKKKVETKTVEDVNIDELVNEGKDIDVAKTEEIIAEAESAIEEKNIEVVNEVKPVSEVVEEKVDIEVVEEGKEEEVIEESIDDLITECTGSIEEYKQEKEEPCEVVPEEDLKEPKKEEPWYVARAKRIGDYYNW